VRVLTVNAGSSSLKLRVLDEDDTLVAERDLPAPTGLGDSAIIAGALDGVGGIDAVGHRVVHGGSEFSEPVLIDDAVTGRIAALTPLAPLHQPKALYGIAAVRGAYLHLPEVACFDTAFHASIPAAAATYAVPREWTEQFGVRRYGFHGLSHAYASRRAAEVLGADLGDLRIVTCHLGAGASLAAVRGGRSVDTTMGYTPLEGLVMATRCGDMDPGLLLWAQETLDLGCAEVADILTNGAGLLGMTGTADMRVILEREAAGDADASLALGVYLHRLRGSIARMTASLGGVDVLVFTGGVGENGAEVRRRAAEGLAYLGVELDAVANAAGPDDREIGAPGAAAKTLVIAAREDLEIAHQTRIVVRAAARARVPSSPLGPHESPRTG
jgi:acetate kinase